MDTISPEQAISILPEGENIHTFVNPGVGMILGADHSRESILEMLQKADKVFLTGETARGMKHGMSIKDGGRLLFIATDMAKLEALDPVPA